MNHARIDISFLKRTATLAAFAFAAAAPATSQAVETSVSCTDLKLERSECLPGGPDHVYWFGGSCTFTITDKGGAFSNSYASHKPFPVEVIARWKAKDKTLREDMRMLGGFEWNGHVMGGDLETVYVCSEDPVIGSAACNVQQHDNDTGLDGLSASAQKFIPLTYGQTTLAEAAKLSTKPSCASKGSSPPPPPPAPNKQAPALKTPKKSTPRLPFPAVSGPGSSQVVAPAASGVRVPERRLTDDRARVPDPAQNPGPPNTPCTGQLRFVPGGRVALTNGSSLEVSAARAAGATSNRVRLLDRSGRPLREFEVGSVCVDGNGQVYATTGGRARPLGRLLRTEP